MPERLNATEMYIAWLVTALTAFGLRWMLQLVSGRYHYFTVRSELRDIVPDIITIPVFGVIGLNFMPSRPKKIAWYVITWTALSLCVESLSVKTHFIVYTGWSLLYSIPFYLLGCAIFCRNYTRRHLPRPSGSQVDWNCLEDDSFLYGIGNRKKRILPRK